ncbi:MAG: helix-turn-helix transcriptional regulator [Candidatus Eremiobacteraeota bacterium]|nr:helix-turn-helix transcriptional regulator [Candidatus Eremiobacteraeota bacterium]
MRRRFRRGWGAFEMHDWGNERRMRRGDVKFLVLETLRERPMHGYDVMRKLEERHEGRYRPSAGSVYPTLQMLEDGGFLTSETVDGKRVYAITDAGRRLLEERGSVENEDEDDEFAELRESVRAAKRLVHAVHEGLHNPETRERVLRVIDEARKEIYKILADEH